MLSCLKRIDSDRLRFLSITIFFTAISATQVLAEKVSTEEWNISADKVIRYEDPSSIVAQGNVILEKKEKLPPSQPKKSAKISSWAELLGEEKLDSEGEEIISADQVEENSNPVYKTTMTIKADWMVYDVELETIKAKGNLNILTKDDEVTAKEGTLHLASETGKFVDATIVRQQKSLHIEGQTIEKTGFDTYKVVDGWVITCKLEKGETPPWSIKSSKTDIRENGYAVLKHATFRIKDFPILYTPYLIVPVKQTRQTGFLFPEISSSTNNGFGFNLPLFINISDSMDATFFSEYHHNRGFMPGLEFRYVSGLDSKGTFTASYLDDKLSDPSETEYYEDTGYTHDNSDRYWVRGKADYNYAGWQTRLDIDIVSDQDYLQEWEDGYTGFNDSQDRYLEEFGRGFQNRTDPYRQNSLKFLKSWDGMSFEADLLGINDSVTTADDELTDSVEDTQLWKLPSLDFNGSLPIANTGINFEWFTDYVYYWREEGIGGHRFDVKPSISSSIPLGPYLESRAEFALRDTYYIVQENGEATWEYDDTQNRLLPEFEAEVATSLQRDFFTGDNSSRSFSHLIRPYVKYGYIGDVDQDELPYFDGVDTINDFNGITYGLYNYFDSYSTNSDGEEKTREYGYINIEQFYDIRDDASDEPFSDIIAEFKWYPLVQTSLRYRTSYDVYDSNFSTHTFISSYENSRGDQLAIDYSFKDAEDIEQINGALKINLFYGWVAGASVEHSLSQEETQSATGSLTYNALCWSVKFETRYTPGDTTYLLLFKLANIGTALGVDI